MMQFLLLIRTGIICMLLAAASAFFGYQAYGVWSGQDEPVVKKAVQNSSKTRVVRSRPYRRNRRRPNFEVIARKDLFSSDRREKLPEKPKTTAPVKAAPMPDRRFALFGIVIDANEKKALVTNLAKRNAKEKAYIWVKVGDKTGNFNVSEIEPGQIVLTHGGSAYTIRLSDPNQPKKRSVTPKRTKRTNTKTRKIREPEPDKPPVEELEGPPVEELEGPPGEDLEGPPGARELSDNRDLRRRRP